MSELPLWGLKEEVPRKKKVKGEARVGVGWGGGGLLLIYAIQTVLFKQVRVSFFLSDFGSWYNVKGLPS